MKIKILEKIKALSIELAISYNMYVLMRDNLPCVFILAAFYYLHMLLLYYTMTQKYLILR
jgi:hypothetical protein